MMTTATRRRLARHHSKVARQASRRELRAAVADHQDTSPLAPPVLSGPAPVNYRLVISTEVWENYGSRFKPKGGNEYHIPLGDVYDQARLTSRDVERLVAQARPFIERDANADVLHSSDEWITGWCVLSDLEPTYEERMYDDFVAWGDRGAEQHRALAAERRAAWWPSVQARLVNQDLAAVCLVS